MAKKRNEVSELMDVPDFLMEDAAAGVAPSKKELEEVSKLAMQQLGLEDKIKLLQEQLSEAGKELKRISEGALPEAMKLAGGMLAFTLSNGMSIKISKECRASMKSGLEEDAVAWLDKMKLGGIVKDKLTISLSRGDLKQRARLIAGIKKVKDLRWEEQVVEKLDVPWNSMVSVVKDLEKGGVELPGDLFSVYKWEQAKIEMPTKEPKKKGGGKNVAL